MHDHRNDNAVHGTRRSSIFSLQDLAPGHRDSARFCSLENRLRASLTVVPVPERVADSVAAFDLNCRRAAAALLALTLGLVVDAASADRSGLAFFAVSPEVRAEVVQKRLSVVVDCGSKAAGTGGLSGLGG